MGPGESRLAAGGRGREEGTDSVENTNQQSLPLPPQVEVDYDQQ